jgi:hypothetical protein
MTICFKRVWSALTKTGSAKWGKVMLIPRVAACSSVKLWISERTSDKDTDSFDSDIFPESIAARSRTSLISSKRYHPAWRMRAILLVWEAVGWGEADSINWAKPRIALSGVRNSWLMLERNSDLARLAFSAAAVVSSNLTFVS